MERRARVLEEVRLFCIAAQIERLHVFVLELALQLSVIGSSRTGN